jgi:hypothetical protein
MGKWHGRSILWVKVSDEGLEISQPLLERIYIYFGYGYAECFV